jgi:predicted nucleic acid-binding Zn ribbon protein
VPDPTNQPVSRPCAECPTPVPHGTTYCSALCRNTGDDHNDYDGGDL